MEPVISGLLFGVNEKLPTQHISGLVSCCMSETRAGARAPARAKYVKG